MTKKILSTVALACVLSCAPQSASASMASLPPQVQNLMDSIMGVMGDDSKFCAKGSLFGGKVNIRSGDGVLCSFSPFAYLAQKKCGGFSDFSASKCAQKIPGAYKGRNPAQALLQDVPMLPAPIKAAFCMKAKTLDANLMAACNAPVARPGMGAGSNMNSGINNPGMNNPVPMTTNPAVKDKMTKEPKAPKASKTTKTPKT